MKNTKDANGGRWIAQISVLGKVIHLGCFGTDEEAADSYNAAAGKYFGDFAQLNCPPTLAGRIRSPLDIPASNVVQFAPMSLLRQAV